MHSSLTNALYTMLENREEERRVNQSKGESIYQFSIFPNLCPQSIGDFLLRAVGQHPLPYVWSFSLFLVGQGSSQWWISQKREGDNTSFMLGCMVVDCRS